MLLVACGPSKEYAQLIQAAAIHDEATEIGHRTSMGVSQLKSLESRMDQRQLDSLRAITNDLNDWYQSLVEVPGHEHEEHDHDHDHAGSDHTEHDHDHNHELNYLEGLSSEEIRAIQVALKKEIEWIEARVINLMNDIRETGTKE